jgi:hypothetical protein
MTARRFRMPTVDIQKIGVSNEDAVTMVRRVRRRNERGMYRDLAPRPTLGQRWASAYVTGTHIATKCNEKSAARVTQLHTHSAR